VDPLWNNWLRKVERDPPSKEDAEKFYAAYDERMRMAREADARDEEIMSKWRTVYATRSPKADPHKGEDYKPEGWQPNANKTNYS
jgi:DNA/RNA-binding domain of Phe-tRNA-synthetase-like protein